jgi:hypothetical protein
MRLTADLMRQKKTVNESKSMVIKAVKDLILNWKIEW